VYVARIRRRLNVRIYLVGKLGEKLLGKQAGESITLRRIEHIYIVGTESKWTGFVSKGGF
jgi:hypothetical protein